jgi:hypothetical protein
VRGQAVVLTTLDDFDSSPSSVPPPLLSLQLDVQFTFASLLTHFFAALLVLSYLLVAMTAKVTITVLLFPATAAAVLTTLLIIVVICQDAEIPETNTGDDMLFVDACEMPCVT